MGQRALDKIAAAVLAAGSLVALGIGLAFITRAVPGPLWMGALVALAGSLLLVQLARAYRRARRNGNSLIVEMIQASRRGA